MNDWDKREQELIELLDTALATISDNPIHEQYVSRNIVNYLTGIKILNEIKKGEMNGATYRHYG